MAGALSDQENLSHAKTRDLTGLLRRWSTGERDAGDELMVSVGRELDRLAHHYLARERRDHTLETCALVNEVYLKLIDQERVAWQNRAHFFALAAQNMRRILVDHARARSYLKRGGDKIRVELDEALQQSVSEGPDVLEIDDALMRLAEIDAQRARLIELRFFGGLSHPEIAEVLGVSLSTVERSWRLARAWLYKTLG